MINKNSEFLYTKIFFSYLILKVNKALKKNHNMCQCFKMIKKNTQKS